ncbi:MAG: ABC transporter permease [Acidobacteria bacterium]|nr:ABC transporter permease [Acidobacteriota bacterium]
MGMDSAFKDVRFAVRTLFKNPGPTLAAVFALMLGIGANSAIFSVVNGVLLKPLNYPSPDRLAILWEANPGKGIHQFHVAPPDYRDWLEQARSFDALAAYRARPAVLTGGALPERLEAAAVSARMFELLGARAAAGRVFQPGEDQPGRPCVAVLSHGLWLRRFGGDRAVVGSTISLDGGPCSVVGVADARFRLPDTASELWLPYALDPAELKERGYHTLKVIGRLAPGRTLDQARDEMQGVARNLARLHPDTNAGWTVEPVRLGEQLAGAIRPTLMALAGAVSFVLLIACSNVAILLLTRASGRNKEIAIRAALGATRGRIVRQLLTESVLLSVAGGGLGLLLAWGAVSVLRAPRPGNIPRIEDVTVDWRVAAYTLAVCLATGILFGLFPALTAARTRLNETLRDGGRTSQSALHSRRSRAILVTAELALSVVLLVGAGLMLRSLLELRGVDPGFRPTRVLTAEIALPAARYHGMAVARFFERLLAETGSAPGVRSVAVARNVPLSGGDPSLNFVIEHRPAVSSAEQPRAKYRAVSAAYFSTMGIPMLRGRYFSAADSEHAPGVAIINEALARRFFPGEDPVGKRMRPGFMDDSWCTIVGVAGNVKHAGLDKDASPEMYYPFVQVPPPLMNFVAGSMTLAVATNTDPAGMADTIRRQVRAIDPDQPVFHVRTMEDLLDASMSQPKFQSYLLGAFAALALALSLVGLYGVISFSVNQRSSEMAVRMALGADRGDLLRLVLGEGMRLAVAGVLLGLGLAFVVARGLSRLLYGVGTADPATFLGVPLLLLAVTALAIYLPAMRAARTDPALAVR